MQAIQFLISEHKRIKKAFYNITKIPEWNEEKQKMFFNLCQDLIIHEHMEHVVWYPNFENYTELKDIVKHLLFEEEKAESTIKKFIKTKNVAEKERIFIKLKEAIEHHASEEETKLFPKIKEIFDQKDLEKIGQKMAEFKNIKSVQ